MDFLLIKTKVFAVLSLQLFAILISADAQIDSSIYQLPAGTKIRVRMDNEINSKVSSENDTFTVKISEPVRVRDAVVLPIGTIIEGRVTKVNRAAFGGKNGSLEVSFETLWSPDGGKQKIQGELVNRLTAESSSTATALTIGGGTALGGIIGAISKAQNGALIGAVIGAGAGTSVAFARKGKDVRIKTDEEFEIELTKNVTLPVRDY